ncbi:CGNR zinc finger domain-containing protein [Actinomadura darangshiensis]|uniref:CGNR zinc finger domain-containing protein n=1 Tax=Actinomadura darangshiensis TaxID=705336 RepID=A0A4R5BUB4_9ACTN|nr:CGNR zinc finger domain-containing protein [Actinomadura darangshiensis]TDD88910.1 CGNR zinc finger domain-containing protein [Actinomadura darangshiensis]
MLIPIADYAAGVEVANDLVGTSPDVRGSEAIPGELADLLAAHDFRAPDAADAEKIRFLRGEVRAVMESATEDEAVERASLLAGHAGLAPVLRRDPSGRWQWYVPTARDASLVGELAAVIGVALLGLVRALGHGRFRACAAPGCGGVFADASRAGRRRYCTPELCGNRLNVANHRARRRAVAR